MNGVPEFDQRGMPFGRVADGNGAGGPRIDMGEYERQPGEVFTLVVCSQFGQLRERACMIRQFAAACNPVLDFSLMAILILRRCLRRRLRSPTANGNLIGGPVNGVIDPLLGPLADNGGPTQTHALLAGSPAIDAGDPLAVAGMNGVPEFDQRGMPFGRVADGNGAGGPRIDMRRV